MIPAGASFCVFIPDTGMYFTNAINIAVTGAASLTDNTAITTGCSLNYSYV